MNTKKHKRLLILLAVLVCIALAILAVCMHQAGIKDEKLKVTVMKTGKSDAIVLQSDGRAMLIDTAEVDDADKITQYLKEEGVTDLDAIIITHFDKDHVGAAGQIAEQFNVERVLIPDYEGTVEEYYDFMKAMNVAMIEPERVSGKMQFRLGEADVLIEPPVTYDVNLVADAVEDYDNTLSLITTVTCGEKRFLFTGDADRRRVKEWLEYGDVQDCDFLKVPHHGQFNAALEQLLAATTPEYAAITCSKKNPADATTLDLLKKYDVDVFQTRDGRITVTTDGAKIDVRLN